MTPLAHTLRRVLADLQGHEVALVGGLAVSVRTEPRFTRDIDFAVSVGGEDEADGLLERLREAGHRVTEELRHSARRRLIAARVVPAKSSAVVDLLFASTGFEREVLARAEAVAMPGGGLVRVAGLGHLVAMKLLSRGPRRPQDDFDLSALAREAKPEDVVEAEDALGLVSERGLARGKQLGLYRDAWALVLPGVEDFGRGAGSSVRSTQPRPELGR